MKKYFLGLDIGTDSIGWAVTDELYNLLKFNGKAMWGSHLFEAGNTAAERRMHRSARRRRKRQVQRNELLRQLFQKEVEKIDSDFYKRMDDSFFYAEDKEVNQKNTLFNDGDYDDKKYHEKYPTIYHLRYDMMHTNSKPDIRLLYLAIAHIIKHRGHFLFYGEMNVGDKFDEIYKQWCDEVYSIFDEDLSLTSTEALREILKASASVTVKKKEISKIVGADKTKSLVELLSGAKVDIKKIFGEEYENGEIKSVTFKSGGFEDEVKDKLSAEIGEDNIHLLEKTKALYDWGVLAELLRGKNSISEAKKDIYDKHNADLRKLKALIKKYAKNKYDDVFKSEKVKDNYASYVGITKNGSKKVSVKQCIKDDFYGFIKKVLKDITDCEAKTEILADIENGTFMPKQVTKDNSVIPYQVNLNELRAILKNNARFYEFLNEKDEYGSVAEKIESLLTFRIPYYIGPLNPYHKKYAWVERKSGIKILPWNFEDVVDSEKTAERFIERMTNMCTYLSSEPVLAKNSVLYSRYLVFNDLNNLRINDSKLPNAVKLDIYQNLFLKKAQVKRKDIIKHIEINYGKLDDITEDSIRGIDGDFKSSMKSYMDFEKIIGDKVSNEDMVDEIIRLITIFGDEKRMLANRISNLFGDVLTDAQISRITKLNYSGWGRISKKLLKGLRSDDDNTFIIDKMIDTDENFMQIINNDQYGFGRQIDEYKKEALRDKGIGTYNSIDDLYLSPANKKRIWRVMVVVKEIVKVMGCAPAKIFVEMARGADENNRNRKDSRKAQLQALYKSIKADKDLVEALDNETESTLRQKKLYLYYSQLGKCMYSGKRIELSDLQLYDIDHIIPRSRKSDDSMDNTVLVYRPLNEEKKDYYPIPDRIVSEEARRHWEILKSKGLISDEKYARLVRKTPLSSDELADFVQRQLVDTRQTTKAAAEALKQIYTGTEIVYVKAGNVSAFRQGGYIKKEEKEQYKDDCLVKVREINDYHHAKDAYLNIVVGNIYNEKFNHNPLIYIRQGHKYNLARIFEYDVERANWIGGHDGTIVKIKQIMRKNNVLVTEMPYEVRGGFYDQNIVSHGGGQYPIKSNDLRYNNFERYGGYKNVSGAYFAVVRSELKGKKTVTIESVPVYLAQKALSNSDLKTYFETVCKMKAVEILVPKLKIHSLLKVGDAFVRITGRSGNRIVMQNSVQLCVGEETEKYIKKIIKFVESTKDKSGNALDATHNGINDDSNIELYDMFIGKLKTRVYNEFLSAQVKNLTEGRDKFVTLAPEDQNRVLYEVLKIFKCDRSLANLSLLGKTSSAGILLLNKKVNANQCLKIINQSPTGLFENEIDILKL